mmetsp:Transcript_15107/g.18180  ORF Transcript_15107/g.18180 Transcript_15107/m.18180 type:complete len:90 (+) Transcript_15107:236-505(+)
MFGVKCLWCLWLCRAPFGQFRWLRKSGSILSSATGLDTAKQGDYSLYVYASSPNFPDKDGRMPLGPYCGECPAIKVDGRARKNSCSTSR